MKPKNDRLLLDMEPRVAPLAAILDLNTRFPIADSRRLGLIAFLTQHDSYHPGQAALLRRQLGRPAMSYARGGRSRPA